jgi:CHAD domain-containing protein
VKTTPERELKLDVDPGFELPGLGGRSTERTFTSTYYDTPDRRLLGCRITLRRRVEQRSGLWQLKLPSADGRCELEERGGPGRIPAPFLDLLPALLRGGADLEPVARLRTRRQVSTVTRGGDRIEVVLDDITLLDGSKIAGKFAELEAETVRGRGKALAAIGKELRKAGARRTDGTPKLARALAHEEAATPSEPVRDEPIDRLRSLLVAQYRALLANDPGVRLGVDPEAVHQARVATRRARALLRAGGTIVDPDWADQLRAELAWLGKLLGPVRDLDVLIGHVAEEAGGLERADARAVGTIRSRLGRQRGAARRTLLAAMSEPRYFQLLDALAAAAHAPAGTGTASLEQIAADAFKRARRAMKALPPDPADDELHAVRIETKRARYAAELAEPVLGKAGGRLLRRAKVVQDVIGEHQDACVAEARIRELAVSGGASAALAAGRLIERQQARKQAARAALPAAWRAFAKAGRKAFG